jgi:hypothetical protein
MIALILSLLVASASASALAQEPDVVYRFPELHNPNPVAGRLYLQPIGAHDDQVIEGFQFDVSVNSYSEYNRRFHDGRYGTGEADKTLPGGEYPDLLFMNGNTFQVRISQGFKIKGFKVEAGAIVRSYLERENSEMQVFLAAFHSVADNSPGHIPPDGQPWGGWVGDQQTVVIGSDGKVFLTSAELYTKLQVLEEKEWIPNVAVKLSVRIPLSGLPFDSWGAGVSVGLSKKIFDWLSFIGAASIQYQDLDPSDFNASNLTVHPLTYDLFGGFTVDPGAPGGFYFALGFRYSSVRIEYSTNPGSVEPSYVVHASLNYQMQSGWELYFFMSEEIPQWDEALEPDFIAGIGVSYRPKAKVLPRQPIPRHE